MRELERGLRDARRARTRTCARRCSELPGDARRRRRTALGKVDALADVLGPTLEALRPGARARSARRCAQTRPFLRETTPIIRDEIRPFARAALPTVQRAAPGDARPGGATPDLTRIVHGRQRAAQHARLQPAGRAARRATCSGSRGSTTSAPAIFATQDAHGPIRRGLVVLSAARAAQLLDSVSRSQPAARHARRAAQRAAAARRSARPRPRPRGGRLMQKAAPSFGRIAAMVVFALSCFGLLLFLWLAFGGPVPLKPKGYRFHASFAEADAARPRGRRADLRRPGRQGQDDRARQGDRALDVDDRARVALRAAAVGRAAILRQKTLLGETYVELTPGTRRRRADARGRAAAPTAQVSDTVELDEILRTFDPQTRAAFQRLDADAGARRSRGHGRDLNDALGNLGAVRRGRGDARRHPQPPGGRACTRLIANTGVVFDALTERDGQLRVADRELQPRVRDDRGARRASCRQAFVALPTFERESRADARPADRVRATTPTRWSPSCGRRRASCRRRWRTSPTLAPDLEALFRELGPLIDASRERLPGRRADARGPAAAARPARPGAAPAQPGRSTSSGSTSAS